MTKKQDSAQVDEAPALNRLMLAFFNPKGGVGKTTTATQTAVAAVMNGFQVAFYDLDPQQSAANYFAGIGDKYRPQFIADSLDEAPPEGTNLIVADCPPNLSFIPPKTFTLIAPTSSTALDLHAFRRVLDLEAEGYKVIKVINNFNQIRLDDKQLLEHLKNVAVISANSGIRAAMNSQKTIWNTGHPGGRKAKRQFNYLLECIARGYCDEMTVKRMNDIANGVV